MSGSLGKSSTQRTAELAHDTASASRVVGVLHLQELGIFKEDARIFRVCSGA